GIDGRADSSSGGETYEAARWRVERGMMVARPGFGDVVSAQAFGNYHLHADVYIPDEQAWVASGARARSGLYLAGRYELEIAAESDGDAGLGAISQQHEPDVELRAERGAWHRLDVHFSHVQDRDPVLSAWWTGERIHDRVVLRERTPYGFRAESPGARATLFNGGVRYARPAGESFTFGEGQFTIAARFKTRANGTIASKSPPSGEWKPDAKALFLRGGRLVYDIGWVGQMETERRYNDGKWHRVLLTHDEHGTAFLFVDGELVCEREDFVKEDDQGHVFKIGAASPDFGMAYRGELSDVTVFEHNVPEDKAEQWTRGEVINMGAPALAWAPQAAPIGEEQAPEVEVVEAPIRLQADCSAVRFANVWVAPLDDVAGVDAPRAKVDDSRWPEYRKMDYGDALHWTYQVGPDRNIVQKGLAVRLDGGDGGLSRGHAFMVYDLDTMSMAAAWSGQGFIDWKGVAFDGSHNSHASIVGDVAVTNPVGPGWAKPGTDDF
ncbi:MAG: family 16 glycoside hydrolase, partial [Planctomycetota bacterium]|nr:family 16 glycoside hydrolase [Planctomycetota bacterium]